MSKQQEVVIKVIESKLSNFKIGWFSAYDTLKGMVALYGADKVQEALTEIIGGLTPHVLDDAETCNCGEPFPKSGYCIFCGERGIQEPKEESNG